MSSYLNNNSLARGLRNNNPGNLIYTSIPWVGKLSYADNKDWSGNPANVVKHFEQFNTLEDGIRAAAMDITNDYFTDGKQTVAQLVYERAPAFENSPEVIIQHVKDLTGLDGNTPFTLDAQGLLALLHAFIDIEIPSAQRYLVTDNMIANGINLMPQNVLNQLGGGVGPSTMPGGSQQQAGGGAVAFAVALLLAGGLLIKKMRPAA